MDEDHLRYLNAIDLLIDNNNSSSDDDNGDNDSTSSSNSSNDGYNIILENDICEDLLFPLLQLLINGRRRQRVQNFLHIIRTKSNEEFREDFRLNRQIMYNMLGNYC